MKEARLALMMLFVFGAGVMLGRLSVQASVAEVQVQVLELRSEVGAHMVRQDSVNRQIENFLNSMVRTDEIY